MQFSSQRRSLGAGLPRDERVASAVVSEQGRSVRGDERTTMAAGFAVRAIGAPIEVTGRKTCVRLRLGELAQEARAPSSVHGIFDRMARRDAQVRVDARAPASSGTLVETLFGVAERS